VSSTPQKFWSSNVCRIKIHSSFLNTKAQHKVHQLSVRLGSLSRIIFLVKLPNEKWCVLGLAYYKRWCVAVSHHYLSIGIWFSFRSVLSEVFWLHVQKAAIKGEIDHIRLPKMSSSTWFHLNIKIWMLDLYWVRDELIVDPHLYSVLTLHESGCICVKLTACLIGEYWHLQYMDLHPTPDFRLFWLRNCVYLINT
jgi:hypothetical protein